ncbi:MAG: His/Gly/Thr/Pro-type tRNA ligase C-terminal domain-containing protein, partial [Candidatus Paceibacterota bacterium]
VLKEANKVYKNLIESGVEVLFDDRAGLSAGEKFADGDLLGMPYRAVVSARSIKENGIELKKRTEEKGKVVSLDELLVYLEALPPTGGKASK